MDKSLSDQARDFLRGFTNEPFATREGYESKYLGLALIGFSYLRLPHETNDGKSIVTIARAESNDLYFIAHGVIDNETTVQPYDKLTIFGDGLDEDKYQDHYERINLASEGRLHVARSKVLSNNKWDKAASMVNQLISDNRVDAQKSIDSVVVSDEVEIPIDHINAKTYFNHDANDAHLSGQSLDEIKAQAFILNADRIINVRQVPHSVPDKTYVATAINYAPHLANRALDPVS